MTQKLCFPHIDNYFSARMDCDLSQAKPGLPHIVETPRRLQCEPSYDEIRACWWLQLSDGRSVINVPPGAREEVQRIISEMPAAKPFGGPAVTERLQDTINKVLAQHGIKAVHRTYPTLVLVCNKDLLQKHMYGECRRLTDASLPTAEGFEWPPYTFLEGILYGVIVDGQVVSVASARPIGILEDRVADIGIVTASAYQRRGYAKTGVSAIAEHITSAGGEAVYIVRPENKASIATARSVGFVDYGVSLTMRASAKR